MQLVSHRKHDDGTEYSTGDGPQWRIDGSGWAAQQCDGLPVFRLAAARNGYGAHRWNPVPAGTTGAGNPDAVANCAAVGPVHSTCTRTHAQQQGHRSEYSY